MDSSLAKPESHSSALDNAEADHAGNGEPKPHPDGGTLDTESESEELPLREVPEAVTRSAETVRKTLENRVEEYPLATLCSTCMSMFQHARPDEWFGEWHDHHQSRSALDDALRMGCAICKLVSDEPPAIPDNSEMQNASCTPDCHDVDLKYKIWQSPLSSSTIFLTVMQFAHRPFEIARPAGGPLDLILRKPEDIGSALSSLSLPTTTASSQVWDLCRYWLYSCRTGHRTCGHRQKDLSFSPARLVYVQEMNDGIIQARLECDTSKLKAINYLTLSHCWGKDKFFTLLKDNLELLQKRIVVEELSKVFQDALLTTLKLGFSYIWIDSLCIIQDSEDDWLQESSRMGDIYKNSSCNMAATGFGEGSRGFYVERDVSRLICPKIFSGWDGVWPSTNEPRSGCYYLTDMNMWNYQVERAALNRRAWVLQERLLSPCILHFSDKQVLWECFESTSCEVFPTGNPEHYWKFKRFLYDEISGSVEMRQLPSNSEGTGDEVFQTAMRKMPLYEFWHEIVQRYCTGQLTWPEDKFLAISGAAKEVRHLLGDTYVAGLWQGNLADDLLWVADPAYVGRTLPGSYRAPTWSWASLDAEVTYIHPGVALSKDAIHVALSAEVSYATEDDTGLVVYGRIRVDGQLHEVIPDKDSSRALNVSYFVSCTAIKLEVYLDLGWNYMDNNHGQSSASSLEHRDYGIADISRINALRQQISRSQYHYLLPIRTRTYEENQGPIMGGLILTPTGRSRGEYIRIGMFVAHEEKALQVLSMPSSNLKPDLWIEKAGDGRYVFDIV